MVRLWKFAVVGFIAILRVAEAQPIASSDSAWTSLDSLPAKATLKPWIRPDHFAVFKLNPSALQATLNNVPMEAPGVTAKTIGFEIQVPNPEGKYSAFRIQESPIMEADLALKYPQIKTFSGQGLDDPYTIIRCDWTPQGFHASVIHPAGCYYVDPAYHGDQEIYMAYHKRDLRSSENWLCLTNDGELKSGGRPARAIQKATGTELRTFRLACAATGEYTVFHGGTVELGLAALVTAFNRVNQVYEIDLATRLILVANNDLIVYTNPNTDPYSSAGSALSTILNENIANLASTIGNSNFDVGHVVNTGSGGIAGLGVVCGPNKARGLTGRQFPTGDPFHIDYIAHEVGHQFGGNHSFNGTRSACSGSNRNAATAVEPGSGSTIMAYAGICGLDNLQANTSPYFHVINYEEMDAFISGLACSGSLITGNTPPTVDAGPNYVIPILTPFTLTAIGADVDGDSLTYCWEQMDLGPAQTVDAADNGASPLFRSFLPTVSPSRAFPRLSDIINNINTKGEKLPNQSREAMKFRVMVRDNHAGGGGADFDEMQLQVVGEAGPFMVTFPNTVTTVWDTAEVTWDVADTNMPPINTAFVNIHLSLDGGLAFPTLLAGNTPNDGSENVQLPGTPSSTARIKVEAIGNVYWDMSNVNFSISEDAACPTSQDFNVEALQNTSETFAPPVNDPNGDHISLSIVSGPTNGSAVPNPNGSITYTPDVNYAGSDSFTYLASDGGCESATSTISINVLPDCIVVQPEVPVSCDELPDLLMDWKKAPIYTCNKKGKCKVSGKLVVMNSGNALASAIDVKIYYSTDSCLDPGDLLIRSATVKKLKPGKSKTVGIKKNDLQAVPNPVGGYLIAIVNGEAIIAECDGTNNILPFGPL